MTTPSIIARDPDEGPLDAEDHTAQPRRGESATDALLQIAERNDTEFFHTTEGELYARQGGKVLPLDEEFLHRLAYAYHCETGRIARATARADALSLLQAKARYEGAERRVCLRVAGDAQAIYLHLSPGRVAQVTASGWRVIDEDDAPVYFRWAAGMQELPEPARNGSLTPLRELLQLTRPDAHYAWVACVTWLFAALRPDDEYPLLAFSGPQDSGKTRTAELLSWVLDPHDPDDLAGEPKDTRDIVAQAQHRHVLVLDNLTFVRRDASNLLCRISTGGVEQERRLHTNYGMARARLHNPVILGGIPELAQRGDLLSRTFPIPLPAIEPRWRVEKNDLYSRFAAIHAEVLGCLLDAAVVALGYHQSVRLSSSPRLLGVARWTTAAEMELGLTDGDVERAFQEAETVANGVALDSDGIAQAVITFMVMSDDEPWRGSAQKLYDLLDFMLGNRTPRSGLRSLGVPDAARLAGRLNQAKKQLAAVGLDYANIHSREGSVITLSYPTGKRSRSSLRRWSA